MLSRPAVSELLTFSSRGGRPWGFPSLPYVKHSTCVRDRSSLLRACVIGLVWRVPQQIHKILSPQVAKNKALADFFVFIWFGFSRDFPVIISSHPFSRQKTGAGLRSQAPVSFWWFEYGKYSVIARHYPWEGVTLSLDIWGIIPFSRSCGVPLRCYPGGTPEATRRFWEGYPWSVPARAWCA